jgi:hypothetical protein
VLLSGLVGGFIKASALESPLQGIKGRGGQNEQDAGESIISINRRFMKVQDYLTL